MSISAVCRIYEINEYYYYIQAEIGKSGLVTSRHDVMTSRHHTNEKLITYLNLVTQNTIETKKIIFLSHLEAKICIVSSLTSWRHVETLRRRTT